MTKSTDLANVWRSLDEWARKLAPWQRRILAFATRSGALKPEQVDEVYELFSEEAGLREKKQRKDATIDISGRPTSVLTQPLQLHSIDGVCGINALPDRCSIEFGPALTVIYGRNGAGKSGFARIFANACFSRHKPQIISNIYASGPRTPAAQIHLVIDGARRPALAFDLETEHPELRRISFFDSAVARRHMSEANVFEYKPSGFDVFPEMVRVYGELASRLENEINGRMHEFNFSNSFIGNETVVSKAVASLSAASDLSSIRGFAVYGPTETARLHELDKQLSALKVKSPKEILASLKQARSDIETLQARIDTIGKVFTTERVSQRNQLAQAAKEAALAAAAAGSEQFKRPFFNAIGSAEWQTFAKAAHALSRKEDEKYPDSDDRCLLCERPFDEVSKRHVAALLAFVEGDAQRRAQSALTNLRSEIELMQQLDLNAFNSESRVREHIHRLDPAVEASIAAFIKEVGAIKVAALEAIKEQTAHDGTIDTQSVRENLKALLKNIVEDCARLEKDDAEKAIASLELERRTIRHREVLKQLLPSIEIAITDAAWCQKAQRAKGALSPRGVTDKEKELFAAIVGGSYRARLAEECERLDCVLPIELQTSGKKGKTVRSLSMKGGYDPETILSEGEQKAVALADFLTEVGLNPTNAGIILDDPVTSQDHQRKERIAERLVHEATKRQVIVFTHDLPFLNQLVTCAEASGVDLQTHWIERDIKGRPGQLIPNDAPVTSKSYDTVEKARNCLAEAQKLTGTARHDSICKGMGALRRTVEEAVVKKLFKGVVPRWSDRVIVTGLKKIAWDEHLVDELVDTYEELSAYIEGHSHTDEATGAPPEIKDLEQRIALVDALLRRARPDRTSKKSSSIGVAQPVNPGPNS